MAEGDYMTNPLVLWVERFKPADKKVLEYKDLYDGVFLNDVMQQIDQRQIYGNVQRVVEDVSVRIINWDILIRNIKGFYLEVLHQLLIWRPPNFQIICREPEKDGSFHEVHKTLLLILGCAVQCEHKETIIYNIKQMDLKTQGVLVDYIREITDNDSEAVLPIEPSENLEAYTEKMFRQLASVIKERDEQLEVMQDLTQERDFYISQAEANAAPPPTGPQSPEKHHIAVELAEIKTKLRHTRQELEDKLEVVTDLKDELDDTKAELAKVKMENADLSQEARVTRSLRDELDIVKEKASKVDVYEKEIIRYKERLNELEFYKTRTQELREETHILEETRTMLEEQLATSRRRVETVVELENEMMKYRQQIEQLSGERDWDRERIELLTEENARLEFEKKTSMNESASLEQELEDARAKVGNLKGSLSEQLTETSNAKILRLELENQRLSAKLREAQEGAVIHSAEVNLQLEKENQRLVKRLEKLQESNQEVTQRLLSVEEDQEQAVSSRQQLQQALEVVKENNERQIQELEQENAQLAHTVEVLRERNEKTNDTKMKELERENRRLTETIGTKNSQLSKMEFDTKQAQRSLAKLQESAEQLTELQAENSSLEKENSCLHQQVATLQHSCQKLESVEHELSDLEVENRKLQKTVDLLQGAAQRKEELEQDNINLSVEKQKLERSLENLKGSSNKVAELESEKDLLNKELQQVRKLLESQKAHKAKQEQLEFDILDLDNENQRVNKALELTTKRLQQLEKDNADIEAENEQLQKQLEVSKMSSKKLEDREKESEELEKELEQARKDKSAQEKENRRLRQALDVKETAVDDATAKLRSLEHDNKALKRSVDQARAAAGKAKELEKENKEMFTEMNSDRKTVATLREELVKEKIHSQELHNQLEKLHQELEHVGISRHKLALAEQSQDESRLKNLESLMQETLKKNSEIKDERIQALETRLEESKKRNVKLQDELRESRRESESVKQRYEEEVASVASGRQDTPMRPRDSRVRAEVRHLQSSAANPTKDILELKDHLVQLERTNATLLADNTNLQSNLSLVTDQSDKLEHQMGVLQTHNTQLQGHNTAMQTQNAQLQVENTTLQSRCTSLMGEKSELQTQLSNLETEHDMLIQRQEDATGRHRSLSHDHETLQDLHKQLSLEYEALISEHGSLKSVHKALKSELKDAQEQLNTFLHGQADANKIREVLDKERQQLKTEQRSLGNLQMDYNRLREDHNRMQGAYDRLSKDYSDALASHKALKSELNQMQLKAAEQGGELSECRDQLSTAINEVQKAENRLETIYQVNERLENENQTLLLQIQQLLNQNQDLLTKALNSKDHFAEEEKQYLEKLSELRRQKERLEEKIMEHYKNRLNSPKKNKGIGAMIARKARNIISRAPRRSKSRPDLTTLNDNSSQGSGSHGDSMEKAGKSMENLKDVGVDEEMEGGFRTLSPAPLVPRGERSIGRKSPGSEMLTLEQFLREANKDSHVNQSPKETRMSARRRSQDDTESRSSENSDQSGQRNSLQRLRDIAAAHQQQQPHHRSDLATISSPMSEGGAGGGAGRDGPHAMAQDSNLSRLSAISSGSAMASDASPPGPLSRVDMLTSTPKADPSGFRGQGSEERGRWEDSERWHHDREPKYAVPHQHDRVDGRLLSGPEMQPAPAVGTSLHGSLKLSGPEPLRSPPPPPHAAPRNMNSRELPPTPADKASRRESLPPTERLDRLTRGPGMDQVERRQHPPPAADRRSDGGQPGRGETRQPIPRSRSVGPVGYRTVGNVSGRGGGESERELRDIADQSQTPRDSSRLYGPGQQGPPSHHGPRPYARPASVMEQRMSYSPHAASHPPHADPGRGGPPPQRPQGGREQAEPLLGGAVVQRPQRRGDGANSGSNSAAERPRSVPPHLFNRPDAKGQGGQGQGNGPYGLTNPVPPPRHGKEWTSRSSLTGGPQERDPSLRQSMERPGNDRGNPYGRALPGATPLPNRYSGPSGQGGNPHAGSNPHGHPLAQRPTSSMGYAGGPPDGSYLDAAPGQSGAQSSRNQSTPGPYYGAEPPRRSSDNTVDSSSPYAVSHRAQNSMTRPGYPGNQSHPLGVPQQQRAGMGSNPPGPQQPRPRQDGGHLDLNPQHDGHMSTTPMARVPPQQTKTGGHPGNRTTPDPSANQRTAVGDDQPHDRPKQNSVWYEYGCV